MKVLLLGRRGKVGSVLGPALEEAGHELVESADGADVAVDFTRPDAVEDNVRACLEAGVPCIIGTTGFDQQRVAALAPEQPRPADRHPGDVGTSRHPIAEEDHASAVEPSEQQGHAAERQVNPAAVRLVRVISHLRLLLILAVRRHPSHPR